MVIDTTADEIGEWATRHGHEVDRDELSLVLRLCQDFLESEFLVDLDMDDLELLLLSVYPNHSGVETVDQPATFISAVRVLLAFLGDTKRIPASSIQMLNEDLDELEPAFLGMFGEAGDDPLLQLLEQFGLPTDRLPPIRLPEPAELVAAARQSPLLARAREFAVSVAAGESLDDVHLRALAEVVEFLSDESTTGPGIDDWPGGADEDTIDLWQVAFAHLLAESLDIDAELTGEDIDFSVVGGTIYMMLFLTRGVYAPIGELAEMIRATTVVSPEAQPAWDSWVGAHGDPTATLIARLAELGAMAVDGEFVRLTPLALASMRDQLIDSGVEVPLLPPPAEMTADDLAEIASSVSEEELAAELIPWLESRSPEEAACQLLEVAAESDAVSRLWATSVVADLGAAADSAWRSMLDDSALRPYAKIALTEVDEEIELAPAELGWITVDAIMVAMFDGDVEGVQESIVESLLPGTEEAVLDAMWRLPHPDALDVLTVIGQYHPDKKVAKLARTAAYKVSTS